MKELKKVNNDERIKMIEFLYDHEKMVINDECENTYSNAIWANHINQNEIVAPDKYEYSYELQSKLIYFKGKEFVDDYLKALIDEWAPNLINTNLYCVDMMFDTYDVSKTEERFKDIWLVLYKKSTTEEGIDEYDAIGFDHNAKYEKWSTRQLKARYNTIIGFDSLCQKLNDDFDYFMKEGEKNGYF